MLSFFSTIYKIIFVFRDYKHKKISLFSVYQWLHQFPCRFRLCLFLLLDRIIFFSEERTGDSLSSINKILLDRLNEDGVDISHIIYFAHDLEGAGSSHVLLTLLRDKENLERRGATILADSRKLGEATLRIGNGAIIYVDDFIGTGRQFLTNRRNFSDMILGNFSEFVLAPVICEESFPALDEVGVTPYPEIKYETISRPLHDHSSILSPQDKANMISLCSNIDPKHGLGFSDSAAMVVFYRNSVNNMPLVFRGNLKQNPYKGIFPRNDDLPF